MAKIETKLDAAALNHATNVCACNSFRKATRAVTQLFDTALQPIGLRSTQFVILATIFVNEPATYVVLSEALVMDRSTLSRNVRPLDDKGWIMAESAPGKRTHYLRLTDAGRAIVTKAIPRWEQAQGHFVGNFGGDKWDALRAELGNAVDAARANGV
jgi:DNA-binding MarR family transcriptional regulator